MVEHRHGRVLCSAQLIELVVITPTEVVPETALVDIRRRVRANPIVIVYSSIGSGYHRREYTRIEDIEGLSSTINLCSPQSRWITMCSPLQGLPAPWIR